MLSELSVTTPVEWLPFASVLTDALDTGYMTTRNDIIVQIADGETAETQPIAWHIPMTSAIVLNATKIKDMDSLKHIGEDRQRELAERFIVKETIFGRAYQDGDLLEDNDYLDSEMRAILRIRGVLAHEAAHSMWSHYLLEPWWDKLCVDNPTAAHVIMQLDEVRIEALQADRSDDYRNALRLSARMLLPTKDTIDEMRDKTEEGRMNLFTVGLNLVLSLGRADQGVLLRYEVRELRWFAEDVLGYKRLRKMQDIWRDFAEIDDPNDDDGEGMIALAEEWIELFTDENGEQEELDLGGMLDLLADLFDKLGIDVEGFAKNKNEWGRPSDMMPSKETAEEIFGKECSNPKCPCHDSEKSDDEVSHGYTNTRPGDRRTRKARPAEKTAATQLAKRLERLSVRARSEVKVRSVVPPGRLKARAAVQQSAARSQGRASNAEPWSRTKRTHNDSPPLTVGVATDVSGSMGWAEDLVASLSWIISKAVRHINGTSAAVVFGSRAEPILGPGDKLTDTVIVRSASDGSEAFNSACAALDGLLRLSDPNNGARILFVVTDGMLVAEGEMAAGAKWVEKFTKSGCVVIWVNRGSTRPDYEYNGFPVLPKGAKQVSAETADIGTINRLADQVAKVLSSR